MEHQNNLEKPQMLIFLSVAFVLPYILGILMGIGYNQGLDVTVFPSAQMFYPASGAILAAFMTRKDDPLLPKRFFYWLFNPYLTAGCLYHRKHCCARNKLECDFAVFNDRWFCNRLDFAAD